MTEEDVRVQVSVRVDGVYGGMVSPFGATFAWVMKGEGVHIAFGM